MSLHESGNRLGMKNGNFEVMSLNPWFPVFNIDMVGKFMQQLGWMSRLV